MQSFLVSLLGLVLSVSVGADPLLKGRVWLASGPAAAGVQVRLFDLTDLRRSVGTTTDEAGYFALPLQTFSTDRRTALPQGFALGQNYPNPFNPSTIIPYQIPTTTHVRLEVLNLLGQRLATLVDGERPAGAHTAHWDATDAAGRPVGAGVYIYRLTGDGHTVSRRMVLIDGQAGLPAGGSGPRQPAAVGVKTEGSVYGLTVAGTGLIAYVDPAFRVGSDPVNLVLEQPGGQARMKVATGGILGDVNNDGQVDEFDVLYVALYSKDPSITLPNNGDISLGDVNGDGTVDLADGLILALYKVNPSDPTLPPGIGQPVDGSGDDHGDTPSSATALAVGSSRSGQIETGGDVDYFRVQVSASGELTVHTTGSLDTRGQLEDSAGAVLARDDDGGDGYNFRIAHTVSAGTYYLKVEGYNATTTGGYTIHASGPGGDGGPDLIVASASVSDNTLTPAQSFTLNATVRNQGTAPAAATTMHYYQSPDATITADDAQLGTGTVSGLSADHTSAVSIDLTAPSSAGTYYYGACVQSVRGESNTDNNCSPGVQVTVGSDRTVNIADANLRAVIAAALGKAPNAPITEGEMATLTSLDAIEEGIRNLAGLEFATNLRVLWLSYNSIADVSPLAGLNNLTELVLFTNNITDVSPLAGLTRLEILRLGDNNIADVSPLAGLNNLTELSLGPNAGSNNNNITDVSPLAGLTRLEYLDLGDNNITDVSPLAGLTRLELLILGSNITDVSPLAGLNNLTKLWLSDNNITDVSPLAGLTRLEYLGLRDNNIADVSPLAGLTRLEYLDLHANSIADVSPLAGLTNLRDLSLGYNSIADVSPLAGLTRLESLGLAFSSIADVSLLAGLTNLRELWLYATGIADVSPLAGLTRLELLSLAANSIADVSPLAGLTNLRVLWLSSNSIADISPLAGLTNLGLLTLSSNSIADVSPLAGLANLGRLHLEANSIADVSPLVGLTNLRGLNLKSNNIVDVSPLVRLTNLTWLDLRGNPLSVASINVHIAALVRRGVTVLFDRLSEGLGLSTQVVTQADPCTLPSARAAQTSAEIASMDSWDDRLSEGLGLSTQVESKLQCGVGTGEARELIYVVNEQGAIIRTLGD